MSSARRVQRAAAKARLRFWLPPLLVAPSLLWLARDRSVWPWDQAWYGHGSLTLFYTLVQSPRRWPGEMMAVLERQAPGVAWLGQWFAPLGALLGSFDDGLLASILVTQALTLVLLYHAFLEVAGQDAHGIAVAGCLMTASAPLFVGLSHQYFTEPLQLLGVAAFVLIMCAAPRWPGAFTLALLAAASGLALLAKVSSPAYCLGPAVVASWHALRRLKLSPGEWRQPRTVAAALAAVVLLAGAAGWYRRNLSFVRDHVRASAVGPVADIYGGQVAFAESLRDRLILLHAAAFRPGVATALLVVLAAAVGLAVFRRRSPAPRSHLGTIAITAALELVGVLFLLSLSPNREPRYLLPLLPFGALLLVALLAWADTPWPAAAAALVLGAQLALSHALGLGLLPMGGRAAPWLLTPRTQAREASILDALAWRTCRGTAPRPERPWNIVGIELPWLNKNSASYAAAKTLAPRRLLGCRYDSIFSFTVFEPDELWRRIGEMDLRYYVVLSPEAGAIPAGDPHLEAINRNYRPVLERLRASGEFLLEPPVPEDPDLLIYRRRDAPAYFAQ